MSEVRVGSRVEALADGEGPPLGPFAVELRTGKGAATNFLPPMPTDDDGWRAWAERAARAIPAELAERLAARQVELGAGAQAVANARALTEPGTVAVVTGQQPGLFGGPLLTAHKVAGAINLARALDRRLGFRVVPLFWSASEDHDFDEANRAAVIGPDGQPQTLRIDAAADGRSIADLALDPGALAAVGDALAHALPDTPRGRKAAADARPRDGEDFATASVSALLRLFGDSGLVVVEPEQLWPESGETLAALLEQAPTVVEAVRSAGRALSEAGLPAPLLPEVGQTPVFFRTEPGGPRLRVDVEADGAVRLRGVESQWSVEALAARIRAHPDQASGNVMGRVFVQNAHLPVLAYVAGPTEIAYQAQLRAAAEALGFGYPLALPRPEVTWIDAKAERAALELGLTPAAVLGGAAPAHDADPEVRRALDEMERNLLALAASAEALRGRGGRVDRAVERAQAELTKSFEKCRSRIEKAAKDEAGVGRGRFERLRNLLFPFGMPQERTLSPWNFVARHGIEAVREGLLGLDPLVPAHLLVHVGDNG